ncbi:MAG: alpha/beta hydrolase [Candidatus Latescibacterota bacterium]|nr:MAG: alpha/beta hydrolase [Candidatus Latescibacterota bacterium]
MKNVGVMILLCCTLLLFVNSSLATERHAVVGGIVKNAGESALVIGGVEVIVADDGSFAHEIELEKASYVTFKLDTELPLFLILGDSLYIEVDAKRFYDSMQISGRGGDVNRFILGEVKRGADLIGYFNQNIRRIAKMDEDDYATLIDSLAGEFTGPLEAFIESRENIDDHFARTQRATIEYSKAKALLDYPYLRRRFAGVAGFWPSQEYFRFVDGLDLNNPELLEVDEYRSFLEALVGTRAEGILTRGTAFDGRNYKEFRAKHQVVMETFKDPTVRSEMLYFVVYPLVAEYNLKGADDLLESFRTHCTNPDHRKKIDEMVAADEEIRNGCEIQVFKTVDGVTLDAFIYRPRDSEAGEKRTALAFFHGGGWSLGKPEWGDWQCRHFSSLGLVCVSFQYRLKTQHGVTPLESIADAKSAIRWMRQNAHDLGIDPNKIVGSGFSDGGHLATCTVMIDRFDEPDEDHTVSSAANALMLWSTPVKIIADSWFDEILRGRAESSACDPAQHIKPGLPPSIVFQGTMDDQVPPRTVQEFVSEMKKAGNRCDLHIYEGQTHLEWGKNGDDVLAKMDQFLISIGFLE